MEIEKIKNEKERLRRIIIGAITEFEIQTGLIPIVQTINIETENKCETFVTREIKITVEI